MQIAKVIPNVKTSGEGIFDYAIPPEILPQMQIGILVLVPFHGRKIFGIVIDIKKTSKIEKLKSIIKVIDPFPVIDDSRIRLARWISEYYLTSYGQTIFSMLPDPAIRSINKDTITTKFARADLVVENNVKLKENKKPLLLVADFVKRMEYYKIIIDKTIAAKKSVIILVPDLSLLKYFNIKNKIEYHSNMTKSERWTVWNSIRNNNSQQIIIGSNTALFAPVINLGLIIVDQEDNETYKNFRSPRYHAVNCAIEIGRITNSNIILGSITPSIDSLYLVEKNKMIVKIIKSKSMPEIKIVNQNSQKSIISSELESDIFDKLKNNKKILLYFERKGEGTRFSCTDCKWVFNCPNCDLPLIPKGDIGFCYYCNKGFTVPEKCPKCNSINLKKTGMTTGVLENKIKKIFPKARILRIEKEKEILPRMNNWDIAITTSYGLKFSFPKISLVGIIDAEQGSALPNYCSTENSFSKMYKFLKMGDYGVIQSHFPESKFISALAKISIKDYFKYEIELRRQYLFPPICKIIRLIYQDISEEQVKNNTRQTYNLLVKYTNEKVKISEPGQRYIYKKRGKYQYQIIIKLMTQQAQEILKIVSTLPNNWVVDVDPVDLL